MQRILNFNIVFAYLYYNGNFIFFFNFFIIYKNIAALFFKLKRQVKLF